MPLTEEARRKNSPSFPNRSLMKLPSLTTALLAGFVALSSTGCAVFSKNSKQTVVVRSTPAGAVAKINGAEVGRTPFKVRLNRDEVYRVELEKPGFAAAQGLFIPSTFVQGDSPMASFGSPATSLFPSELDLALSPSIGESSEADRFAAMTALIGRADAMLSSGQISASEHKTLVAKIAETFESK